MIPQEPDVTLIEVAAEEVGAVAEMAARIAAGSLIVIARARNSAAPGKPRAYQPICLRAILTPVSVP